MDPEKEVTPQIEAEIEAEARWAMQYAGAIKYHGFLGAFVIDATHPGAAEVARKYPDFPVLGLFDLHPIVVKREGEPGRLCWSSRVMELSVNRQEDSS